jgi:hypothetical protein
MQQARGQAQGDRRVIGPGSRREIDRSAASHVGHGGKAAALGELDSRAYGIPAGQPEQAVAAPAVLLQRRVLSFYRIVRQVRFP